MRRKNAGAIIDAQKSIIWGLTRSNYEVGRVWHQMAVDIENGNFDAVQSLPFVVRVIKGTSKRDSLPPSVRRDVRSVGKCAQCGATDRLTVDHIKPYSLGGTHERSNLQCLCLSCNVIKSNKWEANG